MFLILASSVAALAAAPVHSTQIAHASTAYTATYQASPTVHLSQIDAKGPRAVQPAAVCRWQAELVVNRAVEAQGRAVPAVGKAIHRFAPLNGTYAGRCSDARHEIDATVARYSQARSGEAVAVAQQDRAVLTTELDGLHAVTAKGG